jgi:tetratricopeptide (TPR) repeat protein
MKERLVAFSNACTDIVFSFLIFFVPVFFVYGKGKHYYFSIYDIFKEVSIQSAAAILLGLYCIKIYAEEKTRVKHSPLLWPLLFFFLTILLSVFQAYNIHEAIIFLRAWFARGIILFVIYNYISERGQIKRYLNYLILVSAAVSFYGVLQHCGVDFSFLHQNFTGNATFGNPNFAVEFILLVFPIALMLVFADTKYLSMNFYIFSAPIMFVFLVLNKSRATWIGGFFAFIIIGGYLVSAFIRNRITYQGNKKEKAHALWILKSLGLCAAVGIILIIASFTPLAKHNKQLKTLHTMTLQVIQEAKTLQDLKLARGEIVRGDTATQRILIWKNSLGMVAHNSVLGVGIGNYKIRYQPYRTAAEQQSTGPDIFVRRSHNEYVQLLAEIGLFGIAFFFWVIIASIRMCLRIIKKTKSFYGQILAIGILLSLVSTYISIFFNFSLQTPTPALGLFLVWLILMASYDEFLKIDERSEMLTAIMTDMRKILRVALLPLALGCFILPFWLVRPSIAFYNYQFGQACEKMGLRKDARVKLERSLDYFYPSWETHFVLANIYAALGDLTKARWHHEYSLELNPYHQKGHYNLANTLYKLGEADRAIEHYKKGIEIDSIFYQSYNNLGSILYKEKRYEEALEYFRKVTELQPDYFSGQYNMGYILALLNRYEEATAYAQKAVALEPQNQKARRLLAELLNAADKKR